MPTARNGAAWPRTTRQRLCARPGCDTRYDSFGAKSHWPARYCSPLCALRDEKPRESAPRAPLTRRSTPKQRRAISVASPEQRTFVAGQPCLVNAAHEGKVQPAHLIPRGMLTEGQEDARAVVPLCPSCHRLYDDGNLSLLEYLEPRFRVEIAFAVERFGLLSTLRRVTNERSPLAPVPDAA